MTRSLNAPLSPNEEITLRRVALGMSDPNQLSTRDLARLLQLMLIVIVRDHAELTPLGRQRYYTLPRAAEISSASTREVTKLLDHYIRAARTQLKAVDRPDGRPAPGV